MIELKSTYSVDEYSFPFEFSHGFVGTPIDDRSQYSIEFVKRECQSTSLFQYRQQTLDVVIDGVPIECHLLEKHIEKNKPTSVLVDSTSLDIPELALILKALHSYPGIRIVLLYVEPIEYTSGESKALEQEDFALSNEISGFEGAGIPTVSMLSTTKILDALLYLLALKADDCKVLLKLMIFLVKRREYISGYQLLSLDGSPVPCGEICKL